MEKHVVDYAELTAYEHEIKLAVSVHKNGSKDLIAFFMPYYPICYRVVDRVIGKHDYMIHYDGRNLKKAIQIYNKL